MRERTSAMTIEECYAQLGGDYAQVLQRLPSANLVKKFLAKFPADDSFAQLESAMAQQDRELAFRAAHTLKGVCANLGLERLRSSASDMTELLRTAAVIPEEAPALMVRVQEDYRITIDAIQTFLGA